MMYVNIYRMENKMIFNQTPSFSEKRVPVNQTEWNYCELMGNRYRWRGQFLYGYPREMEEYDERHNEWVYCIDNTIGNMIARYYGDPRYSQDTFMIVDEDVQDENSN
jgi:hypothetical protein